MNLMVIDTEALKNATLSKLNTTKSKLWIDGHKIGTWKTAQGASVDLTSILDSGSSPTQCLEVVLNGNVTNLNFTINADSCSSFTDGILCEYVDFSRTTTTAAPGKDYPIPFIQLLLMIRAILIRTLLF